MVNAQRIQSFVLLMLLCVSVGCGTSDEPVQGTGGSGSGKTPIDRKVACPSPPPSAPGPDDPAVSTHLFKQVSLGAFSCGIDIDDELECWGRGDSIEPPAGKFVAVSVGRCQACAIDKDGRIVCWGCPLGDGGLVPPSGTFVDLAYGFDHLCAIRAGDRSVVCSGGIEEQPPPGRYDSIRSVSGATCGMMDELGATGSNLRCWGSDSDQRSSPPPIRALELASGAHHFCALAKDGEVSCWGLNNVGQTMPPPGPFVEVSAQCALRKDGHPLCWGEGDHSQLLEPPPGCFLGIESYAGRACALRSDQRIVCWSGGPGESDPP